MAGELDANGVLRAIFDPVTNALRVSGGAGGGLTQGQADALYQPIDSDLTAIAALSTTSFGRSLLASADAAALRTLAATDATYQPLDSDLTAVAALTTTSYGRAVLALADTAALRNYVGCSRQVMSDAGAAGLTGTNTASAITMLAGTKPDIAANTLAVGDMFRYEFGGNLETVGGAATTMTFQLFWDANNIGNTVTASIAITTLASWIFTVTILVTAIGASGSVSWNVLGGTNVAAGATMGMASSTAASIDTTQALTQDCKVTTSSNNANNTFSCTMATGIYTPKFV